MKRCKNGTRKNQSGECIKKSEIVKTLKRCKNGTRKTQSGCVKKSEIVKTLKRCENGTHKNKRGECVRKIFVTPRTAYANRYFKKPAVLLNKDKNGKMDVMFQVSYKNPQQFLKYQGANDPDKYPERDCLIQSLFSLGLRDIQKAKEDSRKIFSTKKGVNPKKTIKYIKEIFDIDKENIVFKVNKIKSYREIEDFLDKNLYNNHASILSIGYRKKETGEHTHGHALIVYKENNILHFFDPQIKAQNKKRKTPRNFLEFSLSNLYDYDENADEVMHESEPSAMRWYNIINVKNKKKMVKNDCIIHHSE